MAFGNPTNHSYPFLMLMKPLFLPGFFFVNGWRTLPQMLDFMLLWGGTIWSHTPPSNRRTQHQQPNLPSA